MQRAAKTAAAEGGLQLRISTPSDFSSWTP